MDQAFGLAVLLIATSFAAEKRTLDTVKSGEVLIERDHWGVPHIYGQSMPAVAFGAGYAQAEIISTPCCASSSPRAAN